MLRTTSKDILLQRVIFTLTWIATTPPVPPVKQKSPYANTFYLMLRTPSKDILLQRVIFTLTWIATTPPVAAIAV